MKHSSIRFSTWIKALRKYKKLKSQLCLATNTKTVNKLNSKLDSLSKRIFKLHKRYALGVSVLLLSAWMNNTSYAQTINLSTDIVEGVNGETTTNVIPQEGDFDGDGIVDYLVGSHVIWGTGETPELDVANLNQGDYAKIKLAPENRNILWEPSFISTDFNGDGINDIISGVPGDFENFPGEGNTYYDHGRIIINFGGASFRTDTINVLQANQNGWINLYSDLITKFHFGAQPQKLGDFNGDGLPEIIFGNTGGLGNIPTMLYSNSIQASDSVNYGDLTSAHRTENIERYFTNVADINGDGIDDMIVNPYGAEKVTILFGNEDGFGDVLDLSPDDGVEITGTPGEYFGYYASVIGDINHDGFNDISIGNYDYYGTSGVNESMYIIFGQEHWPKTFNTSQIDGTNGTIIRDLVTGHSGAPFGDYNGDGIDDFIIHESWNKKTVVLGSCGFYFEEKSYTQLLEENPPIITSNESAGIWKAPDTDYNNDGIFDYHFSNNKVLYGIESEEKPLCNFGKVNLLLTDESGQYPLPNTEVVIDDLGSWYSGNDGYVRFRANSAGTYNMAPKSNLEFISFEGQSIDVNVASRETVIDTVVNYKVLAPQEDYAVNVTSAFRSRPGFDFHLKVDVKNKGVVEKPTSTVNITLPSEYIVNEISNGGTQIGNTIQWDVNNLGQFEVDQFDIKGRINVDATLGNNINFVSQINSNSEDDIDVSNNLDVLRREITGSYDPNDKTTVAEVKPEFIQNGEFLDYLIRFQNTGNDTAFTVVVTDTLSADLQWESFELISTSHEVITSRMDDILHFQFNNILLVDSITNEPESHGYIRFKIKPEPTLISGDKVEGEANIYFDYNKPIITNNMITRILTITALDEIEETTFSVFPNPTTEWINIEGELTSWQLLSLEGIPLSNGTNSQIDMEPYNNGVYLLVIDGQSYKVIKN